MRAIFRPRDLLWKFTFDLGGFYFKNKSFQNHRCDVRISCELYSPDLLTMPFPSKFNRKKNFSTLRKNCQSFSMHNVAKKQLK